MTEFTPAVIALVRHGETDWNNARRIQGRTEVPLNDTGREQARATGELLASLALGAGADVTPRTDTGHMWHSVTSSPLSRAHETAAIIAASLRLTPPQVDQAFIERDFGPAEGMDVAEAMERWPGLVIPGAESLDVLAERTAREFDRVLTTAPGSIVVAHGAMLRAGLARITNSEIPRILNGEIWLLRREHSGDAVEVRYSVERASVSEEFSPA